MHQGTLSWTGGGTDTSDPIFDPPFAAGPSCPTLIPPKQRGGKQEKHERVAWVQGRQSFGPKG
jgi:hypothetical protein